MDKDDNLKITEASVKQCYSTWGQSYYPDYYESKIAYPPVHVDIVRKHLEAYGSGRLLDAGCGPASMLRNLEGLGFDRFGFDLTPEMVAEAKLVMKAQGVPTSHIWQGSVVDQEAYLGPDKRKFDASICFGVMPHIPVGLDEKVLTNLTASVCKGGLVMVEARNQLFALFTMNRYSRNFLIESLIDLSSLKQAATPEEASRLDKAISVIEAQFRVDLPAIRKGQDGEPGYDEVISRTHNPFELRLAAERAGLREVSILFYHYHCMPPMVEPMLTDFYRRNSIALEDPSDWRGHFMASAFILAGYRA